MFGVEPLGAVFLAENAVIGPVADDQRPHRLFRRPVGDGDGVEGRALELVLHRETRTEMRQDRRAGGVGEPVEKGDERVVAVGIAHGRSSNDAPPLQCDEPRAEASAGEPADRCPPLVDRPSRDIGEPSPCAPRRTHAPTICVGRMIK